MGQQADSPLSLFHHGTAGLRSGSDREPSAYTDQFLTPNFKCLNGCVCAIVSSLMQSCMKRVSQHNSTIYTCAHKFTYILQNNKRDHRIKF